MLNKLFRIVCAIFVIIGTFFPSFTMAADEYPFSIVTIDKPDKFIFGVQVKGTIYVDCGDDGIFYHGSDLNFNNGGSGQSGNFTSSSESTKYYVLCAYSSGGNKEIKLKSNITSSSGNWTYFSGMSPTLFFAAASPEFDSLGLIKELHGSLGGLFPGAVNNVAQSNAGSGVLPCFYTSFRGAKNLDYISDTLLKGYPPTLRPHMFRNMFADCTGLTHLPSSLGFDQMVHTPMTNAFVEMFKGCANLTGTVPIDLFKNVAWSDVGGVNSFGMQAMQGIFDGTNLDTCCPIGTKNVTPDDSAFTWAKYTNYWETGNGLAVACASENATGTEVCATPTLYEITLDNAGGNGAVPTSFYQNTNNGDFYANSGASVSFAGLSTLPSKSGFVFGGYFTGQNGTGTQIINADGSLVNGLSYNFGGNATIYAKWNFVAKFTVTTTEKAKELQFRISPAGTFYVDCGDANAQFILLNDTMLIGGGTIVRNNTNTPGGLYKCVFSTPGSYTVSFGSENVSGYYTQNSSTPAITFNTDTRGYVSKISGSLGNLFPRVSLTNAPIFYQTFKGCVNLQGYDSQYALPANLFTGVPPKQNTFFQTFMGCTSLSGKLPATLFSSINGVSASLFESTFENCSSITGFSSEYALPPDLFSGISGLGGLNSVFKATFKGCTGLVGNLPETLFSRIYSGDGVQVFQDTFNGCTQLTGIVPPNFFGGFGTDGLSVVSGVSLGGNTFANTGLLTCCPAGMRQVTAADTMYSTSRFVGQLSGRVSCISGTPASGEATSVNGACVTGCEKTLKTSNGYEFPLYTSKVTPKAIGIKSQGLNNGETCYAPLKNGLGNLNINDGALIYHVATAQELNE